MSGFMSYFRRQALLYTLLLGTLHLPKDVPSYVGSYPPSHHTEVATDLYQYTYYVALYYAAL